MANKYSKPSGGGGGGGVGAAPNFGGGAFDPARILGLQMDLEKFNMQKEQFGLQMQQMKQNLAAGDENLSLGLLEKLLNAKGLDEVEAFGTTFEINDGKKSKEYIQHYQNQLELVSTELANGNPYAHSQLIRLAGMINTDLKDGQLAEIMANRDRIKSLYTQRDEYLSKNTDRTGLLEIDKKIFEFSKEGGTTQRTDESGYTRFNKVGEAPILKGIDLDTEFDEIASNVPEQSYDVTSPATTDYAGIKLDGKAAVKTTKVTEKSADRLKDHFEAAYAGSPIEERVNREAEYAWYAAGGHKDEQGNPIIPTGKDEHITLEKFKKDHKDKIISEQAKTRAKESKDESVSVISTGENERAALAETALHHRNMEAIASYKATKDGKKPGGGGVEGSGTDQTSIPLSTYTPVFSGISNPQDLHSKNIVTKNNLFDLLSNSKSPTTRIISNAVRDTMPNGYLDRYYKNAESGRLELKDDMAAMVIGYVEQNKLATFPNSKASLKDKIYAFNKLPEQYKKDLVNIGLAAQMGNEDYYILQPEDKIFDPDLIDNDFPNFKFNTELKNKFVKALQDNEKIVIKHAPTMGPTQYFQQGGKTNDKRISPFKTILNELQLSNKFNDYRNTDNSAPSIPKGVDITGAKTVHGFGYDPQNKRVVAVASFNTSSSSNNKTNIDTDEFEDSDATISNKPKFLVPVTNDIGKLFGSLANHDNPDFKGLHAWTKAYSLDKSTFDKGVEQIRNITIPNTDGAHDPLTINKDTKIKYNPISKKYKLSYNGGDIDNLTIEEAAAAYTFTKKYKDYLPLLPNRE